MSIVVEAGDQRWDTLLEGALHDVFHTRGFHRFAAAAEGGRARMIVVGDADRGIAWPYVLRPLSRVEGLERSTAQDVGTSLGYSGPLTWGVQPGDAWLVDAWRALRDHWREQDVVSVFTRFHPILADGAAGASLGSSDGVPGVPEASPAIVPAGLMVSIDLTLDDAMATAQLPRVLRQEIAAARRAGLVTRDDTRWQALDTFVALHRDTMARNHASDGSDISAAEVLRLRDELDGHLHLMTTTHAGSVVAAGLFSEYRGIVQALLVGIDHARRRWSPLKVMLDDVRSWAHARGDRVLHLGGGRGGRLDSLYEFKARFSPRRHRSAIGRWVIDEDAYRELTALRERNLRATGRAVATSEWFPAYRAPLVPRPRVAIPVEAPSGLPVGLRVAVSVAPDRVQAGSIPGPAAHPSVGGRATGRLT